MALDVNNQAQQGPGRPTSRMRMTTRWLALGIVFAVSVQAQEDLQRSKDSFRPVEILITPIAKKGIPLQLLDVTQVTVLDDGITQLSVGVNPADKMPLALGILVDASSRSRALGSPFDRSAQQEAIAEFARSLDQAQGKIFVFNIAEGSPNLSGSIDYSDRGGMEQLMSQATGPRAGGELLQSIQAFQANVNTILQSRKVALVVANGGTFLGPDINRQIVDVALRDRIVLYVVNTYPGPSRFGPRGPSETSLMRTDLPQRIVALNTAIKQELKDIARDTGGSYFEAFRSEEFSKVLTQIRDEISRQYIVSYFPSPPQSSVFHAVRIKAMSPNIAIQAPKGYFPSR